MEEETAIKLENPDINECRFGIHAKYLPHLESHGEWLGSRLQGLITDFCEANDKKDNDSAAALLHQHFGYRPRISAGKTFPNLIESSTLNQRISSLKNGSFTRPKQLHFYYYFLREFLLKENTAERALSAVPESIGELFYAMDKNGTTYNITVDENNRISLLPLASVSEAETSLDVSKDDRNSLGNWFVAGASIISFGIVLAIVWISQFKADTAQINTSSIARENLQFPPKTDTVEVDIELLSGPMIKLLGDTEFTLGCLNANICVDENQPAHRVVVKPFLLGQTEITFAQYDRFCEDTGCIKPGDNNWGRDDRPVINVSWHDAVAFIEWLNKKTELTFRLPTEAELEYAMRTNKKNIFSWGNKPNATFANGDEKFGWPADGFISKTAPVASFAASAFDLYDLHGNVAEWVADCWHDNYDSGPADGNQPWRESNRGDCNRRVHRGGGHTGPIATLQSARRAWKSNDFKSHYIGFRLARDISDAK